MLLDEYDRYEPFFDDCRRIKPEFDRRSYPPLGDARPGEWPDLLELVGGVAERWNLDRIPEIKEQSYAAFRYKLCEMDTIVGRSGEKHRVFRPTSIPLGYSAPEDPRVIYGDKIWTPDMFGGESLALFRQRVMAELEVRLPQHLPAEVEAQLDTIADQAQKLGWKMTDITHGLRHHVRWLFVRLCPQPDAVWGWARIAEEEHLSDVPTVKRTVEGIARDMEIDLPPLPRGRPRKGRRYT